MDKWMYLNDNSLSGVCSERKIRPLKSYFGFCYKERYFLFHQEQICGPYGHINCLTLIRDVWPVGVGYQLGRGKGSLAVRFMGPTWDPSGAERTQVGPMLAPWTLLSGVSFAILKSDLCSAALIAVPMVTSWTTGCVITALVCIWNSYTW